MIYNDTLLDIRRKTEESMRNMDYVYDVLKQHNTGLHPLAYNALEAVAQVQRNLEGVAAAQRPKQSALALGGEQSTLL